eukprot:6167296-Amphidinium_carterae.1
MGGVTQVVLRPTLKAGIIVLRIHDITLYSSVPSDNELSEGTFLVTSIPHCFVIPWRRGTGILLLSPALPGDCVGS